MKKLLVVVITVLLGILCLEAGVLADEKKEDGKAKVPKLMFKTDLGEAIKEAKELEHGEKVAVVTEKKIFVYDKKGTLQWQKNFDDHLWKYAEQSIERWDEGYIRIIDEGKILALTQNTLHFLDANGREKWSYKPGYQIENYAFSEEGKRLAIVYIDKDFYLQLELLKTDEHQVKSIWRYKLTDKPLDIDAYERREPIIINIIDNGKGIVLDSTPFKIMFFDDKGGLRKQIVYSDKKVVSDFTPEEELLTVIHEDSLFQYDTTGREIFTMKLPDGPPIDPAVIYYFSKNKTFYFYDYRKAAPIIYVFNTKGNILAKNADQMVFSRAIAEDDFFVGSEDATDTISKFDSVGINLWSKKKPEGDSISLRVDKKQHYVALGQDNLDRYLDNPTLSIFALENGDLLWQAKLGNESAKVAYSTTHSNFLPVIVDRRVLFYFDLKPILLKGDSHAEAK